MDKLREYFDEMVVYKDLQHTNFFSSISLPSFLRDWLLRRFEDDDGEFDVDEIRAFIDQYIPRKEEWLKIKDRIIFEGERVKLLTKISVDIDIRSRDITFSLPDFDLKNNETIIEPDVWRTCKDSLTDGNEIWGIVELGYLPPGDDDFDIFLGKEKKKSNKNKTGKIKLVGFTDFRPYTVDLDYFKEAREEFSIDEWIDILLGAIDYNAAGYENNHHKIAMLTRLLPFVEKRLNLLELAPKGTGKSYVFGNISKYGMLTDGGKVTRAKMFYDSSKMKPGFIVGHDFVVVDEVKLVKFGDNNEMRSIMQGYMEKGSFNIAGHDIIADAGIVFLGNIDISNMDEYKSMFSELPELFRESALVDRIHGFIKGWDIPRMNDSLKISGWALNTEYFSAIMHLLRDDLSYRAIVDELILVPEKSDTRDTEAVKRIATAYLKLLFPNVTSSSYFSGEKIFDFQRYCLRPAVKMRSIIKRQMGYLDEEFKGKDLPDFRVRETV